MPSRMTAESNGFCAVIGIPREMSDFCHALVPLGTSMGEDRRLSFLRGLARGDLLDQIDDTAPELRIGDAGEGARQRQSFRRREEIRNVGRRGLFTEAVGIRRACRTSIEKEGHRDLE